MKNEMSLVKIQTSKVFPVVQPTSGIIYHLRRQPNVIEKQIEKQIAFIVPSYLKFNNSYCSINNTTQTCDCLFRNATAHITNQNASSSFSVLKSYDYPFAPIPSIKKVNYKENKKNKKNKVLYSNKPIYYLRGTRDVYVI